MEGEGAMSTNSNDQGRAYEYAWMIALYKALHELRRTRILNNSSYLANERAWSVMTPDKKHLFALSAEAAVNTILALEPHMEENFDDELILKFQKDDVGENGDVRDIVIYRDGIDWEVGLSIKHNHSAVKHSRLSHTIDFGTVWYGLPCSDEYWKEVSPVFDMLHIEKGRGTNWSDLNHKERDVYVPLLNAFLHEVQRSYHEDPAIAVRMFEYLVGVKDYHKIESIDDRCLTLIQTFNLHGTLGKPSRIKVSALNVPIVELPTEIIYMRFKKNSKTTVEIYMDNGWAFSFRIHSASTCVQPSLKFDIQFISTPDSVLKIECRWN